LQRDFEFHRAHFRLRLIEEFIGEREWGLEETPQDAVDSFSSCRKDTGCRREFDNARRLA
jgi:hypothetical protein